MKVYSRNHKNQQLLEQKKNLSFNEMLCNLPKLKNDKTLSTVTQKIA